MRTIELFAGIGGLKAACPWLNTLAAFDIDRDARSVYCDNFQSNYICCELATISPDQLDHYDADFWWMSPPCTPYTQKGVRKDDADPRSAALLNLIQIASQLRPALLAIENVLGFQNSRCLDIVTSTLDHAGYKLLCCVKCPSELHWPNRRPRFYLVAWTEKLSANSVDDLKRSWMPASNFIEPLEKCTLQDFLDPSISKANAPNLWLDESTYQKYAKSIDRVDATLTNSTTACFASSYGKSITRSGSYLLAEQGYRRFSPREVANLLGFPTDFKLPATLPTRRLWHLLGNSLSLPVVRQLFKFTQPATPPLLR